MVITENSTLFWTWESGQVVCSKPDGLPRSRLLFSSVSVGTCTGAIPSLTTAQAGARRSLNLRSLPYLFPINFIGKKGPYCRSFFLYIALPFSGSVLFCALPLLSPWHGGNATETFLRVPVAHLSIDAFLP